MLPCAWGTRFRGRQVAAGPNSGGEEDFLARVFAGVARIERSGGQRATNAALKRLEAEVERDGLIADAPPTGEAQEGDKAAAARANAKRGDRPPAPEDEAPEQRVLERLRDELTPQRWRIVSFLWNKPQGAGYDTLARIPRAFRGGPTDEAIEKALKRIGQYFNSHLDLNLSVSFFPAKRRAKLNRPPDNPGDK
jgi:hypothetical protein